MSDALLSHDVLEGALGDNLAAVYTGARAYVDDVVGVAYGFLVVLHHQHGIAQVTQVVPGC